MVAHSALKRFSPFCFLFHVLRMLLYTEYETLHLMMVDSTHKVRDGEVEDMWRALGEEMGQVRSCYV